jgi:hypothetical protein
MKTVATALGRVLLSATRVTCAVSVPAPPRAFAAAPPLRPLRRGLCSLRLPPRSPLQVDPARSAAAHAALDAARRRRGAAAGALPAVRLPDDASVRLHCAPPLQCLLYRPTASRRSIGRMPLRAMRGRWRARRCAFTPLYPR